jgi:hypothetical protein
MSTGTVISTKDLENYLMKHSLKAPIIPKSIYKEVLCHRRKYNPH